MSAMDMDERTVNVETMVKMKVPVFGRIEKTLSVKVKVEKIAGRDLFLEYSGSMGTDLIIGGLLTFLSSSSVGRIIEKTKDKGIVVHLNEIEEAREFLAMMELTDILFKNESVVVEGQLGTVFADYANNHERHK